MKLGILFRGQLIWGSPFRVVNPKDRAGAVARENYQNYSKHLKCSHWYTWANVVQMD